MQFDLSKEDDMERIHTVISRSSNTVLARVAGQVRNDGYPNGLNTRKWRPMP